MAFYKILEIYCIPGLNSPWTHTFKYFSSFTYTCLSDYIPSSITSKGLNKYHKHGMVSETAISFLNLTTHQVAVQGE